MTVGVKNIPIIPGQTCSPERSDSGGCADRSDDSGYTCSTPCLSGKQQGDPLLQNGDSDQV